MKRSTERILVTHVGSMPRGAELTDLLIRKENGEAIDPTVFENAVAARVKTIVGQQIDAGVDIGNDGEQSRAGFQTYVAERMDGFGGRSQRRPPLDYRNYPKFAEMMARRMQKVAKIRDAPQAVAPLRYRDTAAVAAECARAIDAGRPGTEDGFAEMFMTTPSPGIVASTMHNAHYASDAAYLAAIADEIAKEYAAIVEAGLVLQIDAPDLAMERCILYQDLSDVEFRDRLEANVDALNRAVEGLPRERIRLHCCWGNWDGPHDHDVALAEVLPALYRAEVGGLSLPLANPRHQHELRLFADRPPPDHMVLLPGVIDTTNNYVEHPQLVADRLIAIARAIDDPTRIIASTDCGFGTFAGFEFVAEDVIWAKMKACRAGADLATGALF